MTSTTSISQEKRELTSNQIQSSTIDLLRFPLAIMVIFIHMNPVTIDLINADFPLFSGRGIYNVIAITLSHALSSIAVPTFFLISGYLFFLKTTTWTALEYQQKMRRRLHSLIIPYFLWNTLAFLIVLSIHCALVFFRDVPITELSNFITSKGWHIFYDCNVWGTNRINWLGQHRISTGPYDLPLWFLRDLIIVSILSPVIYFFIRKLKIWFLIILSIPYMSRIWPMVPGFSIVALFYFSVGAYFSLNKLNVVSFATRYKFIFVPLCIVTLCSLIIFDGAKTYIGDNIRPFYVFTGVFTAFYIASQFICRFGIKPNKFLVSSCFFVYALHTVGGALQPILVIERLIHLIIPGDSDVESTICLIITPFLTAAFCASVYAICRKLFPKLTLVFSGNK